MTKKRNNKSYPRLGYWTKIPVTRKTKTKKFVCPLCSGVTEIGKYYYVVCVQWSWFRGDDSVVSICGSCKKDFENREVTVAQIIKLTENE